MNNYINKDPLDEILSRTPDSFDSSLYGGKKPKLKLKFTKPNIKVPKLSQKQKDDIKLHVTKAHENVQKWLTWNNTLIALFVFMYFLCIMFALASFFVGPSQDKNLTQQQQDEYLAKTKRNYRVYAFSLFTIGIIFLGIWIYRRYSGESGESGESEESDDS